MELLVEFIMELLGGIMGEAIDSPRVPKVIRSVLICLLCIPLSILLAVISVQTFREGNVRGGVFCVLVVLMMSGAAFVLLRRVWKR